MGLPVVILLLLIAVALFIAVRGGYIRSETLADWANIAAIVAFLAAVLVFVVPVATSLPKATITQLSTDIIPTSFQPTETIYAPTNSGVTLSPALTKSMATATILPSPTLTFGESHDFTVGDYFIYEHKNQLDVEYLQREEITGIATVNGYRTWVVAITFENFSNSIKERVTDIFETRWVDQNTGVLIKIESHTVNARPASYNLENQPLSVTKSIITTSYDLDQYIYNVDYDLTDTLGVDHKISQTSKGSPYIYRITQVLQIGDWYPWKISGKEPQVIKEESVSVNAGTFDCWVIKVFEIENRQYLLQYYDKNTGILVKYESWLKNAEKWEILEQNSLTSFKFKKN